MNKLIVLVIFGIIGINCNAKSSYTETLHKEGLGTGYTQQGQPNVRIDLNKKLNKADKAVAMQAIDFCIDDKSTTFVNCINQFGVKL